MKKVGVAAVSLTGAVTAIGGWAKFLADRGVQEHDIVREGALLVIALVVVVAGCLAALEIIERMHRDSLAQEERMYRMTLDHAAVTGADASIGPAGVEFHRVTIPVDQDGAQLTLFEGRRSA